MSHFALKAAAAIALCSAIAAHAQTTITDWTFDNLPVAINNSPTAAIGTGTASSLGMTNNYSYTTSPVVVGSVTTDDITTSALGNTSSTGANNMWRIRGQSPGNGWNLAAPQYSQGAEFDTSTVGYSNIVLQFDWGSTNQGERNLQVQYTSNGTTWTNVGSLLNAVPNSFINGITVNFGTLGITSVNNDASFGVRLVSAYDPTLAPGTYGGASGGVYNNNSGNWRFDNVIVAGVAAVPEPQDLALMLLGLPLIGFIAMRRRQARS